MALRSEDVVENGSRVVEQVNKLAEQMVIFQKRLDTVGDVFDDVKEKMDESEDELQTVFETSLAFIQEEAVSEVEKVGESLDTEIKSNSLDMLEKLKAALETKMSSLSESSESVVTRVETWRDNEMQELRNALEEQAETSAEQFSNLQEAVMSDVDLMGQVAEDYVEKSVDMAGQMGDFVNESISALNTEKDKYENIMLNEFTTELNDSLQEGYSILRDTLSTSTEDVFQSLGEEFDDCVKSQLCPLIDQLVDKVGSEVDGMMEHITSIGDKAGDKSQSLEVCTDVLEQMISPIRDIIDRTQGIKDVVDVFI